MSYTKSWTQLTEGTHTQMSHMTKLKNDYSIWNCQPKSKPPKRVHHIWDISSDGVLRLFLPMISLMA